MCLLCSLCGLLLSTRDCVLGYEILILTFVAPPLRLPMMMIAAIQAMLCVADPYNVGIPILGSGVAIAINHCTLPIRRRELAILTQQCQ